MEAYLFGHGELLDKSVNFGLGGLFDVRGGHDGGGMMTRTGGNAEEAESERLDVEDDGGWEH